MPDDEAWVQTTTMSERETESVGYRLGRTMTGNTTVALTGALGAGKTVLARGILRGLGISGPVPSPSFVLAREYEGRLRASHWDAYRLAGPEDLDHLDLEERAGGDGILLVEWADRVAAILPPDSVWIDIDRPDPEAPTRRRLTVRGRGGAASRAAEVVAGERARD